MTDESVHGQRTEAARGIGTRGRLALLAPATVGVVVVLWWLFSLGAFQPYRGAAPYGLAPLPVGDIVHLDLGLVGADDVWLSRVEPVVTADSPAIASSVQICPGTRVRTLGHDPEFAPACAGRLIVGRGPGSAEGGVLRHGDFVVMSVIGLEPGPVRILGARLRYRQGIRWATQHAGWKYDFTVAPRQAG